MLLDLTDAASALAPKLTALRRAIHLDPELGLHTPKTRDKDQLDRLVESLRAKGYSVNPVELA